MDYKIITILGITGTIAFFMYQKVVEEEKKRKKLDDENIELRAMLKTNKLIQNSYGQNKKKSNDNNSDDDSISENFNDTYEIPLNQQYPQNNNFYGKLQPDFGLQLGNFNQENDNYHEKNQESKDNYSNMYEEENDNNMYDQENNYFSDEDNDKLLEEDIDKEILKYKEIINGKTKKKSKLNKLIIGEAEKSTKSGKKPKNSEKILTEHTRKKKSERKSKKSQKNEKKSKTKKIK